jgi:hypothetical protein
MIVRKTKDQKKKVLMSDTKFVTMSTLSKSQKQVNNALKNLLVSKIGSGGTPYEGDIVADLIPEMLQAKDMLSSSMDDVGQFDDMMADVIVQALSGKPSYDVSDEAVTRRFEQSVKTPLMRTFQEDIKPQVDQAFAAQGALFSSRRGDATRKALEGLQTTMSSDLANMLYTKQSLEAQLAESAASRQLGAVSLGQQFALKDLQRASAFQQAMSPFQDYEQSKATASYQDFLRKLDEQQGYMSGGLSYLSNPQLATYAMTDTKQKANLGPLLGAAAQTVGTISELAFGGDPAMSFALGGLYGNLGSSVGSLL